jgi:hypothetical protein
MVAARKFDKKILFTWFIVIALIVSLGLNIYDVQFDRSYKRHCLDLIYRHLLNINQCINNIVASESAQDANYSIISLNDECYKIDAIISAVRPYIFSDGLIYYGFADIIQTSRSDNKWDKLTAYLQEINDSICDLIIALTQSAYDLNENQFAGTAMTPDYAITKKELSGILSSFFLKSEEFSPRIPPR